MYDKETRHVSEWAEVRSNKWAEFGRLSSEQGDIMPEAEVFGHNPQLVKKSRIVQKNESPKPRIKLEN